MKAAIAGASLLMLNAFPSAHAQPKTGVDRPNVVLILMDDLGYGDLGSYGARDVKTPNIDRLARRGVRFTESYANGAVCTPTRAALITGRYPQRVGLERALGPYSESVRGLRVSDASLPKLLKQSGYATGLIGKWHLGYAPGQQPNAHGFDEFFGFLGGVIDYYHHTGPFQRHDLYENNKEVQASGYLTDELTRRAVNFIRRRGSSPFFLEVAYNATHMPFQPPPDAQGNHRATPLVELPGDPGSHTRQDYIRMLERVDEGIGEIIATIESRGLASNTLIIFTNDNGGEWLSRNDPFINRKGTLWEGGIRVPLIMYWPTHLPVGRTTRQVALTMDLTATVLATTRTANAEAYPLDGINLLPSLRGDSAVRSRDVFWRIVSEQRLQRAIRSGNWKLLIDGPMRFSETTTQVMLFDLATDPTERHDVAASHQELVGHLRRKIATWENDVAPATSSALISVAGTSGAAGVIARYRVLQDDSTHAWQFDAGVLNTVGYWLLENKQPADAIKVFRLNVDEYPDKSNPHDSLGEAYLAVGDTVNAINSYRRSVQLDQTNTNGIRVLKRLGVRP